MNSDVLQDWAANRGNWKSGVTLVLFRSAQLVHRASGPWKVLGLPVIALYVLVVEWLMGVELNYKTFIGPGLKLYHGTGLVIHHASIVGANCTLRHCTTLGEKKGACPVLGNNVDVGSNVVILGGIKVGDGAVIGAGSVVVRDVAPGDVVAGNPARSVKKA